MDQWVLVVDDKDATSNEQLAVCKALKPPLRGVVVCETNTKEELCREVDMFPAFCNANTNSCTYGLRKSQEELDALLQH